MRLHLALAAIPAFVTGALLGKLLPVPAALLADLAFCVWLGVRCDTPGPSVVLRSLSGALYLTRWNLLTTPWFRVYVHRIDGPDPDRAPHNHPTEWCCFVLHGGYTHVRVRVPTFSNMPSRTYTGHLWGYPLPTERIRWWNHMTRDVYHRITDVKPHTWTLCFSGPRKDTAWGFLVREGVAGFRHIDHKPYLAARREQAV